MAARRDYQSYLLRMWRVGPEPSDWRAMLENPSTGERHGFASLAQLCAWVQAQGELAEARSTTPSDVHPRRKP